MLKRLSFLSILFLISINISVRVCFPSAGKSSQKNFTFLRDQFATSNYAISTLNIVDGNHTDFTLGHCDQSNGFNVCSDGANANCCMGDSNYNASAWTMFTGMKDGVFNVMACFAVPDFSSGVSYSCYNLAQGSTATVSIAPGVSFIINAQLQYFDEENPGYESDFDTSATNTPPTSIGRIGQCPSCTSNNTIINCAGYVFAENAYNSMYDLYDKTIPEDPNSTNALSCDALVKVYQQNCQDQSLCACDASCQSNNFIPPNLRQLEPIKQECYLCNQTVRQAQLNCNNAFACMGSFLFSNLQKNVSWVFDNYGKGTYICVYKDDGTRFGCSKIRILSSIRHCPRIARIDDMLDQDKLILPTQTLSNLFDNKLVLNPQVNLFQDFPTLRQFRNKEVYQSDPCEPYLPPENGSMYRSTFFNPAGNIIWGNTNIKVSYFSDFFIKRFVDGDTSFVSKAYDLLWPINNNPSLLVTNFGDTIYRITKTYKDPSKNCAVTKNSNTFVDVILRLEYNINTNENNLVAYAMVPVSNYGNNIIDPITKNIQTYFTTLTTSNFISPTVYYSDETGKYIYDCNNKPLQFSAYYPDTNSCSSGNQSYYPYSNSTCPCRGDINPNQIYALINIGSVQRPTLRHFYNAANQLVHPLSLSINQTASSGSNYYVDSYFISVNPANSVNPLNPLIDSDYYIPQQTGSIKVVADLNYYNPNTNTEKLSPSRYGIPSYCSIIFGHVFCANLDPCIFFLNFSLNSSSNTSTSYLSNAIENILTLYCSNRIFCPSSETISTCMTDPINGGLPLPGTSSSNVMGFYNYNKDFRNFITLASGETTANPLVCLSLDSPNWLHDSGNVYIYGPYGNASFDNVLTFIRSDHSNVASTRPLTYANPDINQTYTKGGLYQVDNALMNANLPKNIPNLYDKIFTQISHDTRLDWLTNFTGCSNDFNICMPATLTLRPIEPEEWSMKQLCAPLTSYPTQSNVFAYSRHSKQNDYDMYIPLRCQFLTAEGYSAGGAGMTAQGKDRCTVDGYLSHPVTGPITASTSTEPLIPVVSSTGCNGSYLKGIIDINNAYLNNLNNTNSIDYLALQVGEETHQCKVDNMMLMLRGGCIPNDPANALNEDGMNKLIGGCHDHFPYITGSPNDASNGDYTWKYFWDNSYYGGDLELDTNYNFQNKVTVDSTRNTDSGNSVNYTPPFPGTFHGDTAISLFDPDKVSFITLLSLQKGRSNIDYILGFPNRKFDSSNYYKYYNSIATGTNYGYIDYGHKNHNGGCEAALSIACGFIIGQVIAGCTVACIFGACGCWSVVPHTITEIIYGFTVLIYETCYDYDVTGIHRSKQCGGIVNYDPNFIIQSNAMPGNDDSMRFSYGRRKIYTFGSDSSVDLRVYASNGTATGGGNAIQAGLGQSSADGSITSITQANPLCSPVQSITGYTNVATGYSASSGAVNYNIDNCSFGSSGAFNDGTMTSSTSCNVQPNNSPNVASVDYYTNYPPQDVSFTITTQMNGVANYTPNIGANNLPYCYLTNQNCLVLDEYGSTICNNPCTNNNTSQNIPNLTVNIVANQVQDSSSSSQNSSSSPQDPYTVTSTVAVPYCGNDVVDLATDNTLPFYGSNILNASCNSACPACNNASYCASSTATGSLTGGKFTCTYQISLSISDVRDFSDNFNPYLLNMPYNTSQCSSDCTTNNYASIDPASYTDNPANSVIPAGCQNDSDLTQYAKHSGAGGSGKLTISIPLVAYKETLSGPLPYFENDPVKGFIKVTDISAYSDTKTMNIQKDSDCSFKCPKINIYYTNIPITLPNFSTHQSDLICEYSGSPENDMEILPSRVFYPKKCFIVSNNSNDTYLQLFHGAIITTSNCPVVSCANGMYNADNSRLYGMCLYPANTYPNNSSNPSGKAVYQRAIRGTANVFSGDSTDSAVIYSKLYEVLYNNGSEASVELGACNFNSLNNNFLLNNPLFSQQILNSPKMGLSCDSDGFWVDLAKKNIIFPDIYASDTTRSYPKMITSYLYNYLNDDGSLATTISSVASFQVKQNQSFVTKYNYIEASSLFKEYLVGYGSGKGKGRRVFTNFYDSSGNEIDFTNIPNVNNTKNTYYINLLNSLYSPSVAPPAMTNIYKSSSNVYCPPLIASRIPFDSAYTGNADWNQAVEGSVSVYGVCCNSSDTQIPTRDCLHNGKWGKVNNPCQTLCIARQQPPS